MTRSITYHFTSDDLKKSLNSQSAITLKKQNNHPEEPIRDLEILGVKWMPLFPES